MKTLLTLILGVLFFLPLLSALSISPESISTSMYAGECYNPNIVINNPHETDLVAFLYYTTDLNDTEGLSITGENPFIARKGNTTIPISICTATNFKPETFDINFYSDANIVQDTITQIQIEYRGGGTNFVYKDRNVFVDRNVIVQVPKEIIKEKVIERIVETPVEVPKIITTEIEKIVIKEEDKTTIALMIIGTAILSIIAGAGLVYLFLIKPKEV